MSQKEQEKLKERILFLETEMRTSLQKKGQGPAMDIAKQMTKIQELKLRLIKAR